MAAMQVPIRDMAQADSAPAPGNERAPELSPGPLHICRLAPRGLVGNPLPPPSSLPTSP